MTRTIPASRQTTWRAYADYEGWTHWAGIGTVRIVRPGSRERCGVGCVRRITAGGVSVDEEIVEFAPPSRMAYRVVRGGIPIKDHLGEVTFEPTPEGTRVCWCARFDSRVPGLGWLWRFVVRRVFNRTLNGLERNLRGQV